MRGDEGDLSRGALGMPIVNLRPVGLGPLAGSWALGGPCRRWTSLATRSRRTSSGGSARWESSGHLFAEYVGTSGGGQEGHVTHRVVCKL